MLTPSKRAHKSWNSWRFAHPHQIIVKQRVAFKLRCAVWLHLSICFLKNRRNVGLCLGRNKMPVDFPKNYTYICTCDRQRLGQTSQTKCSRSAFQKLTKCGPFLKWTQNSENKIVTTKSWTHNREHQIWNTQSWKQSNVLLYCNWTQHKRNHDVLVKLR